MDSHKWLDTQFTGFTQFCLYCFEIFFQEKIDKGKMSEEEKKENNNMGKNYVNYVNLVNNSRKDRAGNQSLAKNNQKSVNVVNVDFKRLHQKSQDSLGYLRVCKRVNVVNVYLVEFLGQKLPQYKPAEERLQTFTGLHLEQIV